MGQHSPAMSEEPTSNISGFSQQHLSRCFLLTHRKNVPESTGKTGIAFINVIPRLGQYLLQPFQLRSFQIQGTEMLQKRTRPYLEEERRSKPFICIVNYVESSILQYRVLGRPCAYVFRPPSPFNLRSSAFLSMLEGLPKISSEIWVPWLKKFKN